MNTRYFLTLVLILSTLLVLAGSVHSVQAATITSSALDRIEITPYGKPYAVELHADQQFVAHGLTKDGTQLHGITFTWSLDKNIGTVTKRGIFTATKPGTTNITATSGSVHQTIGVRVTASTTPSPATDVRTPKVTAPATVSEMSVQQPEKGVVLGEQTDETKTATSQSTACSFMPAWAWICILLAYLIIVGIYFVSLGESRTFFWWVWPLLLTAVIAVLFWRVHCSGHQLWVPWLLGLDALLVVLLYIRVLRPKDFPPIPGSTPPTTSS